MSFYINDYKYFFVRCFPCTPDSIELVNWGTRYRCWHWGSIGEWRNLTTGEKLHWL